jgi:DNA-binding MarR family transcriptional regulator
MVPMSAETTTSDASAERRPERSPALMLYVIKQLELAVRARLETLLKPSGVTALQYTALSVLERVPSMSSSDLARTSFVRAQSTSDLVAALMKRGLIQRSADPANRRRLLISLTEEGYAFLAEYDPRVAELEEEMLAELGGDERRLFRRFLTLSRRALDHG